jgi:hypothetical protein
VRNNVGQAMGIANQGGDAAPFSGRIIDAAGDSFISGLHIVGLAAAGITLLAALGVAIFLPARARPEQAIDLEPRGVDGEEPQPIGAGVVG